MKELTNRLKKFRDDRDWSQFHTAENLSKSIAIEAGELIECFQWSSDYKQEKVEEELADVLIYCLLLADKIDVDVEEIIRKKIELNENKYPVTKAKGTSKKYNEL